MRTLFWTIIVVFGICGIVAIQFKAAIRSSTIRATMLCLAATALVGIAVMEVSRVTVQFTIWANLSTWDALVPLGWVLGAIFVFVYAASVYASGLRSESSDKPHTPE